MNQVKIIQAFNKKIQELLETSEHGKKYQEFVNRLVHEYVETAYKFFMDNNISFDGRDKLNNTIKLNAQTHLKDTFGFMVDFYLECYLQKPPTH